MTNWVYINDIDLTYDDSSETFTEMLEKLAKAVPSAFVKVNWMIGSGGGWPQGEAIVHSSELETFLEFFGWDSSDIECFVEDGNARSIDEVIGAKA